MHYGPAMKRTFQMGILVLGGVAIALSLGSAQSGCSSSSGTGTAGTSGTAGTTGSAGTTGDAGTGGGDAGTGGGDAGTGGGGTGGGTAGTGGSTVACRNDGIQVTADITTDTTWACNSYVLMQKIHIDGGSTIATLTIAPGSEIYGEGSPTSPAALISTRNGRLIAVGTPAAPITFTSSALVGSRMPGDTFAGVVMLGKAGINSGTCVNGTGDLRGARLLPESDRGSGCQRSQGSIRRHGQRVELRRPPLRAHPVRRLHHRREQRAQRPDAGRLRLGHAPQLHPDPARPRRRHRVLRRHRERGPRHHRGRRRRRPRLGLRLVGQGAVPDRPPGLRHRRQGLRGRQLHRYRDRSRRAAIRRSGMRRSSASRASPRQARHAPAPRHLVQVAELHRLRLRSAEPSTWKPPWVSRATPTTRTPTGRPT